LKFGHCGTGYCVEIPEAVVAPTTDIGD
jgi:hypothetical protein